MWRRGAGAHVRALGLVALVALSLGVAATASCSARRAAPRRHVVQVHGMQFVPAALVVAQGDTVEWQNTDIVPHTATSKVWDSGSIAAGGTWTKVMSARGVVAYKCSFHPTMTGTVTVR